MHCFSKVFVIVLIFFLNITNTAIPLFTILVRSLWVEPINKIVWKKPAFRHQANYYHRYWIVFFSQSWFFFFFFIQWLNTFKIKENIFVRFSSKLFPGCILWQSVKFQMN